VRRWPTGALVATALLAAACANDSPREQPTVATLPTVERVLPPDTPGDPSQAEVSATILTVVSEPISTAIAPNGEFWLAERGGRVVVFDPRTGKIGDTILDISDLTVADGERGLLSVAIDDSYLYVDYTNAAGDSQIDSYQLDAAGRPGVRRRILTQEQPFANHNGGGMVIGPDGDLYIAFGDGGSGGDPLGSGQDPSTLLGSILRIRPTPEADSPYSIPSDNPFADGSDGRPEVFLIGVRNPWRFTFDPATDDLWIADVGQDIYEEVSLLLGVNGSGLGRNLGWNQREGLHRFKGQNSPGFTDPVFEYAHDGDPGGCSITGGPVYRGSEIPELAGAYLFGDFCTSRLWALSISDGALVFTDLDLDVPGGQLASFGVDPDGEILLLSLSGEVSRLGPTTRPVDSDEIAAAPDGRTYPRVAGDPATLAIRLVEVERRLHSIEPSDPDLADLAHEQQVIYRTLGRNPEWRDTILAAAPDDLLDTISQQIDARISIGGISNAEPPDTMPAWEIVEPLPADDLLAIYKSAAEETGIDWTYLAAINMIETGFGRIVGLSTAGAQGPMQFMPATWAEVGRGSVDDPRDAIPAAARYLVRRGGPADMAKAIRGYNNSAAYVDAVTTYARMFASDPAAFRSAHSWEIHYVSAAGDLWLSVGYRHDQRIATSQYTAEAPWSMPTATDN